MTTHVAPKGFAALPVSDRQFPDQAKEAGSVFYRWRMRQERLRQLRKMLEFENRILVDMGVSRDDIRFELHQLRKRPLLIGAPGRWQLSAKG